MSYIGHWEILLAVLLLFIFFGHKLPSMMHTAGRAIVEIRQHQAAKRQIATVTCLFALLVFMVVLGGLVIRSFRGDV